jgi:hypothetical protein
MHGNTARARSGHEPRQRSQVEIVSKAISPWCSDSFMLATWPTARLAVPTGRHLLQPLSCSIMHFETASFAALQPMCLMYSWCALGISASGLHTAQQPHTLAYTQAVLHLLFTRIPIYIMRKAQSQERERTAQSQEHVGTSPVSSMLLLLQKFARLLVLRPVLSQAGLQGTNR